MLTQEQYLSVKTKYIDTIIDGAREAGGLPPQITLFGVHKDPAKGTDPIILFHQIEKEFMEAEGGKQIFVTKLLPILAKKIKEDFDIYAVAWCAEAWMREQSSKDPIPDDYRDLPIKKEVLMIHIETKDNTMESLIYEIKRNGHRVNSKGVFIDNMDISLLKEESESEMVSGRFMGLIKVFC